MRNLIIATLLILTPIIVLANTHSTNLSSSSNQYWSIADGSQTGLDITGSLTVSLWAKFASQPGTNNSMLLVQKYATTGNQRAYAMEYDDSSGTKRLRTLISSNGTVATNLTLNETLTNNTWYNLVFVFTASNRMEIFINGVSIGNITSSIPSGIFNSSSPFVLGRNNEGGSSYFNGGFDDVRIWSRALSSGEVSSLYSDPCNFSNGSNLQGWWKFDNNGNDSSGNGNDLTNNNSATFVTDTAYQCPDVQLQDLIIFE